MAKGNLFLGTASKSVGDVVLMRRNGKQVSRVRVRTIRNPKTEGQAMQRMIMAAITRFYSPLAACLEKSWEGKNRADSYSAYLKTNAQRGRALGFAVAKDGSFAPVPVKVSNGTMPSAVLEYDTTGDAGFNLKCALTAAQGTPTWGTVSKALVATYGLEEGDQVTFIWSLNDEVGNGYSVEFRRLFIDSNSTDEMSIRDLEFVAAAGQLQIDHPDDRLAGMAVIFSHYENGAWRRSSQYFILADGVAERFVGSAAVRSFMPEWMASETTPTSKVYLNGSEATGNSVTVSINGKTYTFVGTGIDTIGDNKYVYFVGSDGLKYYFKNMNEKSDLYGKYYDYGLTILDGFSDGWGITNAPANVPEAQIVEIFNDSESAVYPYATASDLSAFAFANGWSMEGACSGFGIMG